MHRCSRLSFNYPASIAPSLIRILSPVHPQFNTNQSSLELRLCPSIWCDNDCSARTIHRPEPITKRVTVYSAGPLIGLINCAFSGNDGSDVFRSVIIAKSRSPNSYPSSGLSIVLSVECICDKLPPIPLQFLRAAVHVLLRQPYHCSIGLAKLGTRPSIGPSTMHPTQPSSARSQTKSRSSAVLSMRPSTAASARSSAQPSTKQSQVQVYLLPTDFASRQC